MAKRRRAVDAKAVTVDGDADEADSQSAISTDGSQNDMLIKAVNDMPTCQFKDRYIDADRIKYNFKSGSTELNATLDFKASSDLSKEELTSCFNLISTTSRADYEPSSFGWHPKRKRREMLEEEMRYLLVRKPVPVSYEHERSADLQGAESVAGFLSFMMTHDSSPSVPVLYIYEVHLEERLRKSGLGSHLMGLAESIAGKAGVEKVMLTCFLSNEKALAFYGKRGYEKDECSPGDRRTRKKIVRVDYVILSRRVRDAVAQQAVAGAEQRRNGMLGAIRDWSSKLAGKQVRNGEDVAQMRGWV